MNALPPVHRPLRFGHNEAKLARRAVRSVLVLMCCHMMTFGDALSQPLPPTLQQQPEISDKAIIHRRRCVVVGGGPVGLAAALTLSNPPHCFNVTVLEKTTDEEFVALYDPGKAYLYNVNPRGLLWATKFPTVLDKIVTRGYSPTSALGKILRVPANPDEPIAPMKDVSIAANVTFDAETRSVWIPRHVMVDLMMQSCQEQEAKRVVASADTQQLGSLSIQLGKVFVSMTAREDDDSLVVQCQDGSTYNADLVVGADGISSSVREFLAKEEDPFASSSSSKSWLHSNPRLFRVKKFASPSAGLRLKSLQLPGNFSVPNTTDSDVINVDPKALVVMYSKNTGKRSVSLGMLPVKNDHFVRPANIITRPDHEVWSMSTGQEIKEWMKASFPRLPFDEWVNETEWERFVRAKGVTYPNPQFSWGSAVPSPSGDTGVVLVGDACHSFPPDIGQGINAGLLDIMALDRALQGQDIQTGQAEQEEEEEKNSVAPKLGHALLKYQANRGPEHRALIRLARFGAPYQYNQSWLRDRIGKKIWLANLLTRVLLHRITLGIVPPPALVLANNHKAFSFRRIMRQCDLFNYLLRAAGLAWALRFAMLRLGRGLP